MTPRPIRKVLVANRGEIAVRVIEACHCLGIDAVAVYADADRRGLAVERADSAVALGPGGAAETYLDQAKLLEAALAQGCDAVHPGYGFLSESPAFAQAVIDADLTWIGPHPAALASMGDKLRAKEIAAAAGVATLAGAELTGDGEQRWREQAEAVGYPLLVKAAGGGGGRGMRLVQSGDDLAVAVRSARREASAAFADGTVFAEHWLASAHHIEVQLVADRHGRVLSLGERECSIQRRHQKLIEEAPSPVVDDDLRDRMGIAALTLARAIDYDSVGTVEFLVDHVDGAFYFLEMNTRIQVEHRVTEQITGWDLVATQILSAAGEALEISRPPQVMDVQEPGGHAIEARLYAEDPTNDWLPTTGTVHRWNDRGPAEGVLVDTAVAEGSTIGPEFDPLLAKIVAHGRDRASALGRLVRYLRNLQLHGISSNRDHLLAVLEHPEFRAGSATTGFLPAHPELAEAGPGTEAVIAHAIAAAITSSAEEREAGTWDFAPAGWRNVGPAAARRDRYAMGERVVEVVSSPLPGGRTSCAVDGLAHRARLLDRLPGEVVVELDGIARRFWTNLVGDTWWVSSSLGQTALVEIPRFAQASRAGTEGGPSAPVPGRVVTVEVAAGDPVTVGQTLVVLEAMKVEHQIRSNLDAVVSEVLVQPGEAVDAHQLLMRLEEAQVTETGELA